MTTIAANRKMMVADSKVTCGGGVSYPTHKLVRVGSEIIGATGHAGDCTRLLDWAKSGWKTRPKFQMSESDEDAVEALVLRPGGLYFVTQSYPEPERITAGFFALGSGGKAARIAMMLGCDPAKAVRLACRVDELSGPPIRILKLRR